MLISMLRLLKLAATDMCIHRVDHPTKNSPFLELLIRIVGNLRYLTTFLKKKSKTAKIMQNYEKTVENIFNISAKIMKKQSKIFSICFSTLQTDKN